MELVSVDLETTGTDPKRHEAWEIAAVPLDRQYSNPIHFMMPVTLLGAESKALEVGGFNTRYAQGSGHSPCALLLETDETAIHPRSIDTSNVLAALHMRLKDRRLMGAAVHFDAEFLATLFERAGFAEPRPWHHRHFDLGSFAGGVTGADGPLASAEMRELVPNQNTHTALGDAEWNIDMYNYLKGLQGVH